MKYVIVNEIDRPCVGLVAEVVNGVAYYLHESLSDHPGMPIDQHSPVSMEEFGFDIVESGEDVEFKKRRYCSAKYKNGELRAWQDHLGHFILKRKTKG